MGGGHGRGGRRGGGGPVEYSDNSLCYSFPLFFSAELGSGETGSPNVMAGRRAASRNAPAGAGKEVVYPKDPDC